MTGAVADKSKKLSAWAKNGGARKGAGRKPFTPTDEERAFVLGAMLAGTPHDEIARGFIFTARKKPIGECTLRRYFKRELNRGILHGRLAATAFRMGLSGDEPAMTIFLCKSRLGWYEKQHVQIDGKLTYELAKGIDVAGLTDDELAEIRAGKVSQEILTRISLAARATADQGSG